MTRKGAIAVYLEPWHMDIQDFIDLKKNSGEERRRAHDIFPALWIPDLFMERMLDDAHWTLFDPNQVQSLHTLYGKDFEYQYELFEKDENIRKETIRAKDLWKQILLSYFESGSPFLCWKDTANIANPNPRLGAIRSSNLCTEIFQSTSPDKYFVKIYFNHGVDFMLFDEREDVCLVNKLGQRFIKQASKVTSLDSLDLFMYKDAEDHEVLSKFLEEDPDLNKVYAIEKEKEDGQTAVCNLASVNLSRVNTIEDIQRVVPIAIKMLDNVIDLNYYPTLKAKNTNMMSRAIGLGVMGEHQMIAEKQIHFGSKDHLELINQIMELISFEAINASSDLAVDKGSYPEFEESNWNKGIFPFDHVNEANRLLTDELCNIANWDQLKEKVKKQGMRNGYLMAIAPTSSISILVGTTQAIEPVYKRKWFEENLSGLIPVVVPKLSPETYEFYKPSFEINQLDIIKAAAIRQRWTDQGQSTNIFANPAVVTGKVLNEIYTLAYKLGCKSTYYLRSQSAEAKKAEMDIADRSIECSGCQ